MSFKTEPDVERKILCILRVLGDLQEPAGSRNIARHLKGQGVELSERAVRYHLKLTDERGLTQLVGNQDGRRITEKGLHETSRAMVRDKVGFAISRIEQLAFRTEFDCESLRGVVPANVCFFPQDRFREALKVMAPVFDNGLCVSKLVAVAHEGQRIGSMLVPPEHIGFATVCSIIVNGTLLKAGIPMDCRFGGILQIRNHKPVRFTEVIHYNGCSLDPSDLFIKARMTSVRDATSSGNGEILANFREIPALCRTVAESVVSGLEHAGLNGVLLMGNTSEPVCEMAVDLNKIGIILLGGLNPVAAAAEAGIESENHSMSTVVDYDTLVSFKEILNEYS